jgi:hypothetical protein
MGPSMSRPDTRVRIAFDLAAAGAGDFFTLDDPIKGELDDGPFGLSGDILQDVTDDVRSITVRRGRSRELERYQAGAATVVLDSRTRKYDPSNLGATFNSSTVIFDDPDQPFNGLGSPFAPSMRPRKAVQITSNGVPVFNGVVDDWDLQYSLDGDHLASVKVTDGFVILSSQEINPHTTTAQTSGERVDAILSRSEIAWPAARRAVDTGTATLQADVIGGTAADAKPVNALQYLQKVDEAEQGALFIGADGALTFRGRSSLQVFTDVVFADDGTGIPFTNVVASYGSEELRNRVSVTRLGGSTVSATNAASVLAYGAIDFDIRDSLLADDTQAQSLANAILARYAEPLLRIDDIEVVLNALTQEQVDQVLALELGALVRVIYTPSGIGEPINQVGRLDQIEHTIEQFTHRMRLSFSQGEQIGLVLDSATLGLLDINKLSF